MSTTICLANVGGEFFSRSSIGLKPDEDNSIKSAKTQIICSQEKCNFETKYVTVKSGVFRGSFFGYEYRNVSINGVPFNDSLKKEGKFIYKRHPILGRNFWQNRIQSTKFETSIDSVMTITGELPFKNTEYWGLAELPSYASMRHLLFARRKIKQEKIVTYLFEPISMFSALEEVSVKFENRSNYEKGKYISEIGELSYLNGEEIDFNTNVFSMKFQDTVPTHISFKVYNDEKENVKGFNVGGALLYLGYQAETFSGEIGWEFLYNFNEYLSALPSINYVYSVKNGHGFNYGIRMSLTAINFGLLINHKNDLIYTVGLGGPIGFEFRSKGIYFQMSI